MTMLLCSLVPLESYAWWSEVESTHSWITRDALPPTYDQYPDLQVAAFVTQLRKGSNTESHDVPDGTNIQWWVISPEIWFTAGRTPDDKNGAFLAYTNYDFNGAYLRIGYELHLLQDTFVPAHKYFCEHGRWINLLLDVDSLEERAESSFGYGPQITDWSFEFSDTDGPIKFEYWLSDSMDDDNTNEVADADDEWIGRETVHDGPAAWGVPPTDWGTYGRPELGTFSRRFLEILPGKSEGKDSYYEVGDVSIVQGQLQLACNATLERLKERSEKLPPLIPDDEKNGKPNVSLKIFGPNKPVVIDFYAMENRKSMVFISVLAGSAGGIKDNIGAGTIWDGGAYAIRFLEPWDKLPWRSHIICNWSGETATGQINDGIHEISMQIEDRDGNFSEKRTRSVMFDKTKPTGTITINGLPQSSNP
jgi:hypothetical protein